MGTPASNNLPARSNNAFDLGRSSMNFFCSRCMSAARRVRLRDFMGICTGSNTRASHSLLRNICGDFNASRVRNDFDVVCYLLHGERSWHTGGPVIAFPQVHALGRSHLSITTVEIT